MKPIGELVSWWNNGAGPRGIDQRKVDGGWSREFGYHAKQAAIGCRGDGFTRRWLHCPDGCQSRDNMEIDARFYAKQDPALFRVCDEAELVANIVRQWEEDGQETGIYLGAAEGSPILQDAWNRGNKGLWTQRINSVLRPYRKALERGVPITICQDGAGARGPESPSAAVDKLLKRYGLGRAVEPVPEHDWCNQTDIGVVTFNSYWKMANPSVNLGSKAILYDLLKGRIDIIAVESDPDAEVVSHLAAGRNVAALGDRNGPELLAQARKEAGIE